MPKPPLYLKGFHDFSESDKNELQAAKSLLETPSFIAHVTDLVGKPIEAGLELLPEDWNEGIAEVTRAALLKAAEAAIFTMKDIPGAKASNLWNKALVAATGAGGGFFGLRSCLKIPGPSLERRKRPRIKSVSPYEKRSMRRPLDDP